LTEWRKHVSLPGQLKTSGGNANDGVGSPVENNASADGGWITAKTTLPERVADDGNGRGAWTVFIGFKRSPM
jgi:hypothetical protein